jgi:AraC-like DNA-binding protein
MEKRVLRPQLEDIRPDIGQSFRFLAFNDTLPNADPIWHYHPEVELVFVKGGSGKRHVGAHISYYHHGDMLLIGSNLPHYGFTDRLSAKNEEFVLQFHPRVFLAEGRSLPELQKIINLLQRAESGLSFYGETKRYLGERIEEMTVMKSFERYVQLLNILQRLADSEEYLALNASTVSVVADHGDYERIRAVYRFVREHFAEEIRVEQVASLAAMTVPSFCRYFKKMTGKTFTNYLQEFRIVHSCKLLAEQDSKVAAIAMDCGFQNFSHFSRTFKKFTGTTPSLYRQSLGLVVVS